VAVTVKVKITGLNEIRAAFKRLPKSVAQKELISGLRKGANTWRDAAKRQVALTSRRVANNVYVQKVKPMPGLTATVMVRVRKLKARQIEKFKLATGVAARYNPNDPFFWRFIEFGTSKMAARPFLRPAFEANKQKAITIALPHFRKRIEAALKKGVGMSMSSRR